MYTGGFDMEKITVWTKQHRAVLETLEREGRYVAKRQFVRYENEDCADLVLEVYDWLVKTVPTPPTSLLMPIIRCGYPSPARAPICRRNKV